MHTSHMQKQHIQYNVAGRSIVAHSNQSNAPACLRRHLIACIFVLLFGVLCSRVLPHVCGGWLPPCLPVHTHTQAHIIFYPFLVSLGAQARSNNPSLLIRCARSGCRRCARARARLSHKSADALVCTVAATCEPTTMYFQQR